VLKECSKGSARVRQKQYMINTRLIPAKTEIIIKVIVQKQCNKSASYIGFERYGISMEKVWKKKHYSSLVATTLLPYKYHIITPYKDSKAL